MIITINSESHTKKGTQNLEYFQRKQVGWPQDNNTSLFIDYLLNSKP